MKDEKFLNGTEKGSDIDSATKDSSAQNGAATGYTELDDAILADVTGGSFGGDGVYRCDACGHKFAQVNQLLAHISSCFKLTNLKMKGMFLL